MAISAPGEGFFTSDGVLRTDLTTTQQSKPKTTETTASTADEVAAATAQEITDAAVVSITSSMNVGSTGFDSGVSGLVQQAVSSALKNLSSASSAVSDLGSYTPAAIGGTYQNSILYPEGQTTEPATEPDNSAENPEEIPPGNERGAANGQGKKVGLGGSYQDELIAASDKSRGDKKDVAA